MDDFRPIVLYNTLYKIMAKAMVNRLKPILNKIISTKQHGFVLGWDISDSIILAGETIHIMQHSNKLGMIIKLDVSKAYDRV